MDTSNFTPSEKEAFLTGRYAMAKELSDLLISKGFWSPKITIREDNYSDIILAVGRALPDKNGVF